MNFNELFQKMRELDQPVTEEPNEGNAFSGALDAAKDAGKDEFEVDGKTFQVKEDDVEECGMPMGSMGSSAQQDSISANISMNASGKGGISDLMAILRNIENGDHDDHGSDEHDMAIAIGGMDDGPEPLIGMDEAEGGGFDRASTTPDTEIAPLDAAYPTGDDISSHGGNEAPKVNGGGNPYRMAAETLIPRLSSLYQEVKSR